MNKLAIGIVALSAVLFGCTTTQQATATSALTRLQMDVQNGCMVVQPTLAAVAALDPTVAAAATANGLFCAAAGSITATSIQSMVSTGIPAIEKAVSDSALVPPQQKPIVIAAMGIFQLTLTNAFSIYGQSVAAPVAASQ